MATVDTPDEQPRSHEVGARSYLVADVEPLDVDGVRTVGIGSAFWIIGFVALLPFYGRLAENGHAWWVWTCMAGAGLGLVGLEYCRRQRHSRMQALDSSPDA